ncbi:MAG: ATP synthase F1 subunit epsilon [Verrucomicrobium sp.]|nr:ATP synthase F1 subunit epsilon [Verrucomicrobium sp.]
MATLRLEIVTPETRVFAGDVESVLLPGVEGDLGILPQHAPLLTQLAPGELAYVEKGVSHTLAVGHGFAEVTGTEVSILTDLAVREADIDEKLVAEALQRAEEALRNRSLVGEELEATEASIARSLAQLKLKRRRHPGNAAIR